VGAFVDEAVVALVEDGDPPRAAASRTIASTSASGRTAPVGLFGVLTMTPRVAGVAALSSAFAESRKPSVAGVGTKTGRAPASRTISGNETQ